MKLVTLIALCLSVSLGLAGATRAQTGTLAAPPIPGAAEGFGHAVDADGELCVVASHATASIVNLATGRFEARDLLAALPLDDITDVYDVALKGNRAAVFVERAHGALPAQVFGFTRSGAGPTWSPMGVVEPVADLASPVGELRDLRGKLELLHGTLVVALSFRDVALDEHFAWAMFYADTQGDFAFYAAQFADNAQLESLAVGAPIGWLGTRDEISVTAGLDFQGEAGTALLGAASAQAAFGIGAFQSTADAGPDFGAGVAIHGSMHVVGEPGAGAGGRVVFTDHQFSGALPLAVLTPPAPLTGVAFGHAVAISEHGRSAAIAQRPDASVPGSVGTVFLARYGPAGLALLDETISLGARAPKLGADLSFASEDVLVVGAPGGPGFDGMVAWFELP